MATKPVEPLKQRLHDLLADLDLLWHLDFDDLEKECWDHFTRLDGVQIGEGGFATVDLTFGGRTWLPIEELLMLAGDDEPDKVAQTRSVLEEIRNRPAPAPCKKTKKALRHS